MYKDYESISKTYPIGYVYKTEYIHQRKYCANDIVFEQMQRYYGVDNVSMISPHHADCVHCVVHSIDGYLFDGEEWQLMEFFQGEWRQIKESDLPAELS